MKKKQLTIWEATWKDLTILRATWGLRSLDAVIARMVKKCKSQKC